jgi:hypothetical protein
MSEKFNEMVGKTIVSAVHMKDEKYDDEPYLVLEFSDGTKALIGASFGSYSGESREEYPSYIFYVENIDRFTAASSMDDAKKLIPVE